MNMVETGRRMGALGCARQGAMLSCVAALATLAWSTSAAAQAHKASACGDAPNPTTNLGVWPTGDIPFVFEAGYPWGTEAWAAMHAWENQSGHLIKFREDTSTNNAKLRIHDCKKEGGESSGYDVCKNGGCDSYMCPDNLNHELGHAIGLLHQFERNDRDHYVRLNFPLFGQNGGGVSARNRSGFSSFRERIVA